MFDDFSELSKQYGLGGNDDDDSGKIATPPIPSASSSVSSDDDYEALSKAYGLGVFSPASPTSTSTSKRGKRNRANPGGLTDAELAQAIAQGAKSLGVSPEDYATAIAYETGGTFDPWQAGPTTKWGQHRGTIQYGEPQRKQFGVYQGQGFADQVTGSNVRYLKQRGVRPGATFREIYAAINGGNAKKNLKTFDANTGRTIADNIANANRQWRGIVQNRFGQYWNTGNNSNVSAAADNTDYDSLLARFGSNAEASQFGPNAGSGDLVPDNTDYAALGEQYAPSASPTTNATDLIAGAADKNGQGIRQSGSSAQTPILPSAQPASSPASPAVSTPSPTFAAPYADTSIASGALTDNKGAASNGAINKSVQEAPDTILAQKDSALANDTQRAAVLTTAPELEDQFFTGDADKGMWTPVKVSQGTLWVNNAKARKLKLRSPEDIAMFVERNPDAMARLIGKVENVGDATEVGQPTVVTTAPDGTELSASAVTSPMAAELQVNLDNLNFPQGTSKITDGSDVVAKRQAATGQQSNTVPANTAQSNSAPATPPKSPAQQAFDLGVDWVKELKKAQANPAKIEQDTESETAPAASNSGSGSVKVELDPSDFKVDGKSITDAEAFERGQEVDGGGVFFVPKRVGAANATLDKAAVAGRFRPPQGLTAEDAARRAFLLAGQRYGATDANWQAYKATEAGQNFLKGLNGVVPDRIDVTYNALAGGGLNAKGDRRMEETISANEIANANAAPRQTYTAPPKGVMEVFGEELDKTLGDRDERGNLTPENEAKKAAYNSPSYDDYIESAFQAMRNMPASPVTPSSTIGNEAIARGAGGLATSTSQVLSGLYDSSIFGWTDAGVKKGLSAIFGEDAVKQAAPDIAATLGKFGNSVERVAPKGTPDDEYGVTRFVGDVSDGIGRLPVYVGVGAATGGNPILTFAVVDAASARGKGGTLGETLTAGAKGAAMGAAFSGVSRLANSFTDGIFDGSLKNFLKGKLNIPSVYQAPVEATADQVAKETAARQIGAMLNTIERSSTPAGERLAAQKAVERLLTKHNTTVEDVLSGKLTGKVAQDVADAASKENANLLGRYLTKTGINVGLVSGMGYGIAAASGDEHPGRNALLFGAMELLGSLMHIPPKTAREFTPAEIRKVDNTVLRLPSETGQPRDVIVRATPDGKALTVTDVTGRVPDSAITAAMGGKAITKNPAGAGKPLIEPPAIEKPTGVPLPKMPEVELPTESNVKTENAAIKEKQETGKELETTSPISEPTALVGKNEVLPDAETAASKGAVEEVKQGETDRAEKAERVGRLTVTAPRTRVGRLDITPAKKAEAEAAVEPVEAKVESVETAEPASVKPYDLTPEAYKEAFPLEKDGQSITAENGKTYELHQGTGDKWWVQEPKTKEIKNFNSRGQMRRFLYGHSSHAQAIEAAIKNGESVDAKILAKYPRLEQKAQKAAGDRIFKFQADETAAPIFGEIAAKGLGAVDKAQLASLQGIGEKYHVTPKEVNRLVGASDLAFRRRSAKGKQGQYEDGSRLPSGKVAVGRTASVQIPGEKTKYGVRYVVREANDVQSSHDPFTFQPNLDYELVNNRHYDKSDKLQMDVADHAKASKFSADQVVNNAPTAETGTPVIDRNGNALGGNSRVMTIKRVYASENPQAANAYKAKIKADAAAYGIDPTVIDAFKHPILVREVTDKGYDAQSAITDLNKVSAHDLSAQEAAIAGGGRLSPETLDKVGGILGEYGTVGEALNGRGVDIVHDLIKDGVFTENQVTSLLKDDALTEAGKDKVKDVLFGSLFTDLEQLSYAPSNVRNALERIVSPLLQTHADADWDIVPQVREAVDLLTEREAKAKGTTIDEYAGQQSFVRPEGWSPEAVALAKALDGKDAVSKFKTYAGEYRTAQTGSMFGVLIPSEAFKEAFGVEGKASDAKKAKADSKPQETEALSQIDDVVPRSFVERSHDLWGNDWYVSNKPIARYEETGARRVTQSEYKKNEQAWEASPEGRRWKEYLESKKPPIKSEKSVSPFDTPEGRERMAKERIKALAEEHGVSEQDISAMESAGVLFSTRRDITPEQIIETATDIEKRLIAAGYDARLTRANTTNTRYVTVYEDGYDPIAKIRVSDHDEGALRSNPLNYYGGDNVSDVVQAVKDYKEQSDQDAIKFRAKQDAMRAEIERQRAEKAGQNTEIPLESLYKKNGELNYERIKDTTTNIVSGLSTISHLPGDGERGRIEGGELLIGSSLIVGRKAGPDSTREGITQRERDEEALESYARQVGKWFIYEDVWRMPRMDRGMESTVFADPNDDASIIKLTAIPTLIGEPDSILQFFNNKLAIHNALAFTAPYELIGFTRDENDETSDLVFYALLRQPYIKGIEGGVQHFPEFDRQLHNAGFTRIARGYKKGAVEILDIDTHNVIKAQDGRFYIIDPVVFSEDATTFKVISNAIDEKGVSPRRSEQTDKPLFQRKTDAADRLLHDELPFETDFNKVAKGLKGGTFHKDTGELELKPHDAETARRLLNNVHSIRHGIEVNNPSFDGVVLDAGTLRAMAKEALGAAVDMDKTGYAKSQVDAMNALAKNLNAVATHAKDFGIAYVFDSALPEERVHQDDLRAGRTDAQAIKELKENELWDASPKFDRDYEGISSQDKASEIAAKLATGQEVEYGWNKLPNFRELRRKFLETWLDGIARANKETIDAIGIDTFFDRFTRLKEIRDEIKTDTKERGTQSIEPPSEAVGGESGVYGRGESGQGEVGEQGRGARAETSRVGGTAEGRAARDNSAAETPIDIPTERLPEMPKVELPNDKAEKTAPVESTVKEPTVKEPALAADKPETASTPTTEESGAQKERKTILSAEKWGEVEKDAITGAPRYYRVKSQKPAIAKAQTEIDRIGLDRSFVRALEPLDNVKQEDFAATNIFRREVYYLLGELADKNKGTPAGVAFKEQQEAVLSAMAETGTAGGQLVQSFDPIDRRDARTAVEFTNRQRRKQGWDEPLTEKESEQLKEYAKTLAIQQEALEIAKREIEELKTKAAVGGGGARSSLTGRQKKFITDLRAASDAAIARLHLDEIAPMLSRGTGKRIPNAPLMSRRTPRPSDDELDALADIGANILFDGFQDTDIITQEAFNKRIQEIAGTRYDDHLDLIHAVSMKRLSEMRTEARRQAAIDRVKDANPNATDAEIDKAIADHAKELAERSKARAKHRKTANKVLKAEGIFTEKQKAAYEAKLARQDAKAAQKAQDAVIAAKADADRFLETAVELGYGGTANEDALALALHLYRGDARGETPIGEKEAIKFLQELRPDLKYRLGETGKESHDRVFETAKVVAEADKIRNAVKARYKAERQAALSALTEKQAAMRERRAAVVKASNEYHNLQRAFATVPPSLRNKIKQTTLMAMVSAFNTAANNGLGGIGTRALYRVVDLTEVGLQRVVKKLFPKFTFAEIAGALPPETKFKDIFGIPTGEDAGFTAYFKDMLGSNALMAQVLSEHPELYRKLFSGHSADIKTYKEIGTGTAPTDRFYRRTSAYRAAHHAADAGIWLYDKLNVFNRLQEYGVRGLEAPYFLQLLAGARGENVRDLVKKGEIGSFTEAELAAAVERALRVTFALSPQKGTTAYKVLDRINKYPMASMVFAPFARFGWNVWSMGRDWLPGVAAFRAAKRVATAENAVWRDITNPSKYTAREAANNIAGLVFFATMFGIVRALGDRDDWYYLRVPGTDKFIDVRQHPEIAPFIYLANKFNRFINGQDLFNYDDTASIANELLEVFFGYSYRQAVDQNSLLRIAPKLLKGKGEEAYNLLSQFIGERVGLFFSPARPLKNFTDSLSRTGDLDLDDSPFTEGLSRQLPKMIFEAAGAPPRTKLGTKDEPKRYSKYAYLKPFGLNIVDGETAEPQTSQTVRGLKKSVYDDGKPYEAPILAADKRERNAKREIYALVNKAEASLPKDADNEAKQVAYAPVRAALKDAVGRNWLTQKQADYIDSRLGKTQAAQLAARASISDALTAYETALKDKLVSQREREEITEAIKKKLTTGKGTITARDIQRAEKLGFTVSPMVRQRAKD